jgi:hypothetical protein
MQSRSPDGNIYFSESSQDFKVKD